MKALARGWSVLIPAALVLGGCGWFGGSKSLPAGSASDVVRARVAETAPAATPRTAVSPPPAQDSKDILDRVVAVVNNEAITLIELLESMAYYLHESRQPVPKDGEQALKERLLERLVEQRLQLQEAEREKIVVDEGEITEELADVVKRAGVKSQEEFEGMVKAQGLTMEGVKKRLQEQIKIRKVVRRKVMLRTSVTEEEIELYLLENRDKLETGLGFRARHILISPRPPAAESDWEAARQTAEEVWGMVRVGQDFAELARKYSQDPAAADGGDLGVMKQGELAPEIEAQILRIRPGEAAGPFRTRLGYHIFKLEWRETLTDQALAQTKQQIRDILFRQNYQARLDAWLRELKQRAIIELRL